MAENCGAISQTKPVFRANHSMSPSLPQYTKMGPSPAGPPQCSALTRYRCRNVLVRSDSEKLKWSTLCSTNLVSYRNVPPRLPRENLPGNRGGAHLDGDAATDGGDEAITAVMVMVMMVMMRREKGLGLGLEAIFVPFGFD